jgi:hypothetical protein
LPPSWPAGKVDGGKQAQLLYGWPGLGQVQVFTPEESMPQVTQQSWVHGLPQLTLWQSEAHAWPASESGLSARQVQLPGCSTQIGTVPVLPPSPPDAPPWGPAAPPSEPFEPPVPVSGLEDEQAKNTRLGTSRAATARVLERPLERFLS